MNRRLPATSRACRWHARVAAAVIGVASSCSGAISTLDFTISGAGVEEVGSTSTSLPVYRSGALDQTVTVQYATHDGTAVGGLDYVPVSGTLTFNPGESFKTITINGLDDSIAEGTESFSVALSNPSPNAVLGFNPVSYLYVIDNECLANLVAASFDPDAGAAPPMRYLYALAVQQDGRILVGGAFTEWNQVARPSLARLLPDGSLDTSFVPDLGTEALVKAILVEPDGKIVVAGFFFSLAGHTNIVRLNSDGSVDKTFAATLSSDSWPASLARQSNGKILVAEGTPMAGGRHPLIRRFNLSGTSDNSFTLTPLPDGAGIQRIVVRPDDKIVAAGSFGAGLGSVILLSANGARDPEFGGPAADGLQLAHALEVQPDGKVLVGGEPQHNGSTGPLLRLNADGSPDPEFTVASTAGNTYSTVRTLALQSDGRILIGGSFFAIEGRALYGIARLLPNGALDRTFDTGQGLGGLLPHPPSAYAIAVETEGTVLVAGSFNSVDGIARASIARLLPSNNVTTVDFLLSEFSAGESQSAVLYLRRCGDSGAPVSVNYAVKDDTAVAGLDFLGSNGIIVFEPNENEQTLTIPLINDNLIETEERFSVILSTPTGGAILGPRSVAVVTIRDDDRAPSQVDPTYAQTEMGNGTVSALALQPDGKLLVGGDLFWLAGQAVGTVHGMARFNVDGTLDPSFLAPTNIVTSEEQPVTALALQSTGDVLCAGPLALAGNSLAHKLARLHADGSLDPTFVPAINAELITTLRVQADDSVLVAGHGVYSTRSRGVVRLRKNGDVDPTFATTGLTTSPQINALVVAPDGRILIGGSYLGSAASGVAISMVRLLPNGSLDPTFAAALGTTSDEAVNAIEIQPDGKILVAGEFETVTGLPRKNIARLLPNGTVDPSFNPGLGTDSPIRALLLQPDGRIVLGGGFRLVDGFRLHALARLNSNGSVDIAFGSEAAPVMGCQALLAQNDGRILAGGVFCRRGPTDDIDEFEYCYGVLRLNHDPLPRLAADLVPGSSHVQIRGSVLPGRVYVLEGTPDLQNWTPLQTNTIRTSAAVLEFVEPVLTSPPQRLYRLAERP